MARQRQTDRMSAPLHRTLTYPGVYLMRMLVFLALVGAIAAILSAKLYDSFFYNPFLNGIILMVAAIGVIYAFSQVFRLFPEIRWVNAFRIADPGLATTHQPVLLAPMATMLRDRTGVLSLSTTAMRSIMDSIGSRLDEARDTGRYLVGLLVFLGLLGTFWGLLETILSVSNAISALGGKGGESGAMIEELKASLAAPMKGMGTAFSSSLLGLSGSLVLGFLELQASHAHNRFYNDLEEWLSGITELTPGASSSNSNDQVNRQIFSALQDLNGVLSDLAERMPQLGAGAPRAQIEGGADQVRQLATNVGQLVTQIRDEQTIVRRWLDEQSQRQGEQHAEIKDLVVETARRS